jgi:hypothetical protein
VLKMQCEVMGPHDLAGHPECWSCKPGFDTLKIHASGSSLWLAGVSSIL